MNNILSLRAKIKQEIITLKLFTKTKFNRYVIIPDEFKKDCFDATPNCKSPELKDRIYWIINDIFNYNLCKNCNKEISSQIINFSSKLKDQTHCSSSCRLKDKDLRNQWDDERFKRTGYRIAIQNPEINKKITATNLKQYGVKNPFQSKLIKDKIKAGYLEKHGVENPSQILAVKEKKKQTCLKNYGSEFPIQSKIIREKIEATCLKRYGTKNPIQSPVIREKIKLTNIKKYGHPHPAHTAKGRLTSFKKYGVSHPMQDYAVFKRCMKAAFKLKKYIAKDGVVLSYQGYEDVVLKFLLEELNIPSKDLIISKSSMPRIFYHSSTKNRKARYYPDIFIKASNLILEIKSRYTYNLNPLEAHEKQQASKAMGFNHMILICNKTNIIEIL